jgi:phosphomannomutase|tara:strand:- start:622 stop:1980 length:1359 start_codon:yes stop_codon:yes gene_type:complete
MTELFKAYDLRGKVPEEWDENTAFTIAQAYAVFMKKQSKKTSLKIVVGGDMRSSTPKLKEAITRGLLNQGVDVIDIGCVSTPAFYFGVANNGYDGGLMITASHNPKGDNGIKFVKANAEPISVNTGLKEIQKLTKQNNFKETTQKGKTTNKSKVAEAQVEASFAYANTKKIKPLKVVVDTANGMGAQYVKLTFAKLPCKLIKMYFPFDGNFPNHEADPLKEENCEDLQKRVLKEKADLGITTDGDGDRIFFVDDQGEIIEPAIIRGIIAKIVLRDHPGATICYDIRPGRITEEMIKEARGIPVVTKVGHSLIKEKMKEVDAVYGGESSGHFFFKLDHGTYETPVIMILKMLQEISESGIKISEYIKPLRKYFHSGEINSDVENKEQKLEQIENKYKDAKSINHLDGISIEYEDFWFNVRPSNTESKLRMALEAKTKKIMQQKRDELLKLIRS